MKTGIHPSNYRLVVFEDLNNQTKFLMKSTIETKEVIKWQDGQTYPLVKLHITSASHPFYTGVEKIIDIEGRVDKFRAKQRLAQLARQNRQKKSIQKNLDKSQNQDKELANSKQLKTKNPSKNKETTDNPKE